MARSTKQLSDGTLFHGVKISATPAELTKLFPNDFEEQNDGKSKTNFDFSLETDDGIFFTIYDWKICRPLKMNETIDWNIGAFRSETTKKAAKEINALLETLRNKL